MSFNKSILYIMTVITCISCGNASNKVETSSDFISPQVKKMQMMCQQSVNNFDQFYEKCDLFNDYEKLPLTYLEKCEELGDAILDFSENSEVECIKVQKKNSLSTLDLVFVEKNLEIIEADIETLSK